MVDAVDAVMGKIDLDPKRTGGGSLRPPVGKRKFAILRVKKISGERGKGKSNLSAAARHNLRERHTANARPEDTRHNIYLAGAKTAKELMQLWEERAPEKVRKNAVPALEYVMTASPEEMAAMGQIKSEDYLRDAFAWVEEKHGAENILSAVIHMDETTPHLQVLVIPLDERGKLNARALVGSKPELSAMQTDYAERVGAKYGLERGIERSGASHETIKSYHGRANANERISLDLPERATGRFMGRGGETDAEYHERVSEAHSEAVRGVAGHLGTALGEKDRELAETKLRLADVEAKAKALHKTLEALEIAHNVAAYDGGDKAEKLNIYHRQYLDRASELPENIRFVIDGIMNEQGKKGFEEIQEEHENGTQTAKLSELIKWKARSAADYSLTSTAEDHQEVVQLLKQNTTEAQYSRFRQGDFVAIDHITDDPVFARQLLMEVELNNRTTGYEMSPVTETRMSDSRDFLKSHFGTDRDHERER